MCLRNPWIQDSSGAAICGKFSANLRKTLKIQYHKLLNTMPANTLSRILSEITWEIMMRAGPLIDPKQSSLWTIIPNGTMSQQLLEKSINLRNLRNLRNSSQHSVKQHTSIIFGMMPPQYPAALYFFQSMNCYIVDSYVFLKQQMMKSNLEKTD